MRLAIEPDIAVVGETGDFREAMAMAQNLDPDVIIVDIEMRGVDGTNLLKRLQAAAPMALVIVLTLHGDKETRARAQEAGVEAFLEKYGESGDLLQAIRHIAPPKVPQTSCAASGPLAARRLSMG
jgi:DNA-binding NarL/FixJ family response regulator